MFILLQCDYNNNLKYLYYNNKILHFHFYVTIIIRQSVSIIINKHFLEQLPKADKDLTIVTGLHTTIKTTHIKLILHNIRQDKITAFFDSSAFT